MAANSSANHSSVKLDLKLEMWPVNTLRLEWCYDTGNDKNITIILLMRRVTIYFIYLLDLLDLPVLLSHCVAFMTDLNVGQIISNTNSLVLVQL